MTNDVIINNIINELCQKFNVAATELVPRMQEYGLAMNKLGMVISGIFVALIFVIYAVCKYGLYRQNKKYDCIDSETYVMSTFGFLLAEIIPTIVCIANAVDYVGWKYAPEIKAMEYVVNMFKK